MSEFKPITIIITDLNEPPTIAIDGVETKGFVNVQYEYETKNAHSNGTHKYLVEYVDINEQLVKTIGHQRI